MRTEIDKDFRIERHKEYTIIWPFRTYADEEDKEEDKEKKKSELYAWLVCIAIIVILYVFGYAFLTSISYLDLYYLL